MLKISIGNHVEAQGKQLEYIHTPQFTKRGAWHHFSKPIPKSLIPDILVPRLTREQEGEYFLGMNYAKYRYNKEISKRHFDTDLSDKWYSRFIDYQQIIAQHNMPAIIHQAQRYVNLARSVSRDLLYDELVSHGHHTMCRCIARFDVGKGNKFSTLMFGSMGRTMWREMIKSDQRAWKYLEFDMQESFRHPTKPSEVGLIDIKTDISHLMTSVEVGLDDRERIVLTKRFGLGDIARETLEEVGKGLGLTKERIRQIQENGLRKLRTYFDKEIKHA